MDKDLRDQFTIVRKCRGKLDCLIYEMLFIKEKKPKLNNQSDCTENKTIRPFACVDYVINGKQENSSLLNNFSSTSRKNLSKLGNLRSFTRRWMFPCCDSSTVINIIWSPWWEEPFFPPEKIWASFVIHVALIYIYRERGGGGGGGGGRGKEKEKEKEKEKRWSDTHH